MGVVAAKLGKPFMPWQQLVADVVLEVDPGTGRLVYDELGLTVPRQSGKSTFVLAKAVHRCSATGFFGPRQHVVYTAQTRQKAREKWEEDYAAELAASKVFAPRVHVSSGNGNEHIRFANRSRFGIEANTDKSGHGPTLDEAYLDEAFSQVDGRLEQAFSPAMITRMNKLFAWISTRGWLDGPRYLEDKVKVGRAVVVEGQQSKLAYFEWSAAEDADPGDEAVWWTCMPALGHTISVEAVRGVYVKAVREGKVPDFRRAYLNQSVPKPRTVEADVVAPADWRACMVEGSEVTRPELVVDVAPDRDWSCLAVAGPSSVGGTHVEVTGEDGRPDYREGTAWVVGRAVEVAGRNGMHRVSMAAGGGALALRPALEQAGLEVNVVPAGEVAAACAHILDLIAQGKLRHVGQECVAAALSNVRKYETDGGFRFARRRSDGDITPWYGVTLAAWVADSDTGGVILW